MNLIEALKTLQANGNKTVKHFQGEVWDIDNLISEIDEDTLDESGERGEWAVDSYGIEQLDDNGYRTGVKYKVA